MADDDLNTPLGRNAKKKRWRFRIPIRMSHVVAGALTLFVATFAVWAVMVDDPLGGEPMAVVATGFDAPKAMPNVAAAPGGRSYDGPGMAGAPAPKQIAVPPAAMAPPAQTPATVAPSSAAGGRTVTIIDGSTGKRQEVPIPGSRDVRAPLEQRLLEASRHGPIPRIAADGARPADIYARPANLPANRKDGPKVAIIITGLGISPTVTQQAMTRLPAPMTFAFSPYGTDAEALVAKARADGHEVLLQTPMEPFEYPDNDPGPQTLLATLDAGQNLDRLHWLMSRFQGYVGLVNTMGARFTSTEAALAPTLKETAKRGLIYVDDGSSPRSLAGQIAAAAGLPFAKVAVTLDSVASPTHIEKALARLEALAREHGSAVGIAQALPATIDRIGLWAKAAENRGVVLVPITTVAVKPKSS